MPSPVVWYPRARTTNPPPSCWPAFGQKLDSSQNVIDSAQKVNYPALMTSLPDALFTTTQQRLLALLYGQPERSFYFKELLRLTGMGVATIKRELDQMVDAGLLTRTRRGNQHHYQANPECPIHAELVGIVRKTLGLADILKQALTPLSDRIEQAFVFGSMASGGAKTGSDIDLLVIGDLGLNELARTLYPAQEALGREINPKLYTSAEWEALIHSKDAFASEVMNKPRIDVLGGRQ